MNWYALVYAVAAATFAATEIVAATNARRGDTVSELVWSHITQPDNERARWTVWLGRVAVAGFLVWAVVHLVFGVLP